MFILIKIFNILSGKLHSGSNLTEKEQYTLKVISLYHEKN